MDEALKAVEVCSEEGLQKFLPYEIIQFFHLSQATFATFDHHYYFLE